MKNFAFFFILTLLVISCSVSLDADNQADIIIVGSTEGSIINSGTSQPDTVFKDFQHLDTREFDLNNDLSKEFYLISEEDSLFDPVNHEFSQFLRNLRIVKNNNYYGRVSIATDNQGNIKKFNQGDMVDPDRQTFEIIYEQKFFNRYTVNTTNQVFNYDPWNGQNEKYFVISTRFNDKEYASWIKVTVQGYDNYIFYGFASFDVNWATYKD